jgi:tetratricopeptide (TPR) repeat protein
MFLSVITVSKIFLLVFIINFSTILLAEPKPNKEVEQHSWTNSNVALENKFNALDSFYQLNHLKFPDSTLVIVNYHYQLAISSNQPMEQFEAIKNKGNILRLKGLYKEAMSSYQIAYEIAKKLDNPLLMAKIEGNKGNIYAYQRDYLSAINHFSKALSTYEKIGNSNGKRTMLTSLGNMFLLIQDYKKALSYLEPVLEELKVQKIDDRSLGIVYTNLGWANYKLSNWRMSEESYEKALKILKRENALFYVAEVYANLGRLHKELNNDSQALNYLKKCIELNSLLGVKENELEAKLLLAELIADKDPRKALNMAISMKSSIDNEHDILLLRDLYSLLHTCYKKIGAIAFALESHEMYARYNDSVQKEINGFHTIRTAYEKDTKLLLDNLQLKTEQEKKDLQIKQLKQVIGLIFFSLLIISVSLYYIYAIRKKNLNERESLLKEIAKLKLNEKKSLVVNSKDFMFHRELIEQTINRRLNETDWKVLHILLEDATYSNREIAEKVSMSIDGIGSSLKRMYLYFDVKETKYRKIALLHTVMNISSVVNSN